MSELGVRAKVKRLYDLLDTACLLMTETELFNDKNIGTHIHAAHVNAERAKIAVDNARRRLTRVEPKSGGK